MPILSLNITCREVVSDMILEQKPPRAGFEIPDREYFVDPVVPSGSKAYLVIKRFLDIVLSFLAGTVLLLPLAVVAVIIKIDSKGPVFYKQERIGKNGKLFKIIKFRTMTEFAEENGPQWADEDDERCTKVGAVLRKCRLDELPQLWNIFVGDMSIVGPRPERPYFYDKFEEYIHGFKHRLAVIPGLTGLAQINGGYDLKPEEKILYDMEYIKTCSLWLDIKLCFMTVKLIFTHEGAR